MKILNGEELVGFIKERQARVVAEILASGERAPKLVIVRDNDSPVINKYVELKQQYGKDIGVEVVDAKVRTEELKEVVKKYSRDAGVDGIIVQLPLLEPELTDGVVSLIAPEKDVDGLSGKSEFDSATATAINWLLAGYDIDLVGKKIAVVGYGRLVGEPLVRMWRAAGRDVTVFRRGSNLSELVNFEVVVSATGVAGLIKSKMIRPGAVVVDAGTASEDGAIVGDVEEAVRERTDLVAITPSVGGVGPLTVGVLFEGVVSLRLRFSYYGDGYRGVVRW